MDSTRRVFSMWLLFTGFAAVKAAPIDYKELTANVGQDITLWSELENDSHTILFHTPTVLLNYDNGEVFLKKDNILLDMKTSSIIMLNVTKNDAKVYQLQVDHSNNKRITHTIKLNVTEHLHHLSAHPHPTERPSVDHQRSHLFGYISGGVLIFVATLLLAIFLIKKKSKRRQ